MLTITLPDIETVEELQDALDDRVVNIDSLVAETDDTEWIAALQAERARLVAIWQQTTALIAESRRQAS